LHHQTASQITFDGLHESCLRPDAATQTCCTYNIRDGAIVWWWWFVVEMQTTLLGKREFAAIAFENVPYEERANEGRQ